MIRLFVVIFLTVAAGAAGPVKAQSAAGPASLNETIAALAETGGRIELAGGDYGPVTIVQAFPADRPLVLAAANASDPPRLSGLQVSGASNVVIEGLVLDYRYSPGDAPFLRPFQILSSAHVTLRDVLIDGDVALGVEAAFDGFPTAYGLGIRFSEDVRLETSEIRGFARGIVTSESRDIAFVGNDLHSLRSDGMDFAQVEDVLVEGNHIHDFARSEAAGDHADMIQFWTSGTTGPTRNVTIRDNILESGQSAWSQSIFIRNELVDTGTAGDEMFYRNITIENNFIHNAHLHGISVGEVDGLVIRGNTLLHNPAGAGENPDQEMWRPRINVSQDARNVVVTRNVTHALPAVPNRADWQVSDNLVVQDRSRLQANFYGTVFEGWDWRRADSFVPRPGGPLDGTRIGASLLP